MKAKNLKKQTDSSKSEQQKKKVRKPFVPAELKRHESLPVITAGSINLW
ncbi:MAG: hypothetical protein HKN13_11785 [Rhodothermales bacterium]|nr:hypothetical protein [Rhodothermales bacterium]